MVKDVLAVEQVFLKWFGLINGSDNRMKDIVYQKGDATSPQASGVKIICHICNDIGGWGKGFVLAISRRWKEPEAAYRAWHASGTGGGFALGEVQFVQVEPSIWVANMIGQHGLKPDNSGPPIRYDAVEVCLFRVATKARELGASVHMPRIGCGLAGGNWVQIEALVKQQLSGADIAVRVYDFE